MEQVMPALSSQDETTLFMGASMAFSKEEIQTLPNLREVIESKADNLRRSFIVATIAEINKRGWAEL